MTTLLELEGVTKSFGAVHSLVDVSFAIEDQRIIGLIGPNGAGKSTLINVLAGVYPPNAGAVRFAGHNLAGLSTAERARAGLVRTFQRPTPILDLTCIEGVMAGGLCRGLSVAEARREARDKLELLGLAEVAELSPRKLPTGHLKLLDFLRVLMLRPRLVLLDEMMAGLSITELEVVQDAIEHLARNGVTFLVVEHMMDVIRRLSRHLVVMDAGRIVAEGEPATVIRDPQVVEAYLGDDGESAPVLKAPHSKSVMLDVSGIRTGYEGVEVVHGIDLCVNEGETVCVLGANGAGKSTMLRAIMRQLPLWAGSVQFLGHRLTEAKAFVPAHHGMGYVPGGRGTLASLSVRENLEMGAYPSRAQASFAINLERVLALFPALQPRLRDAAGNLSGGQAQMLAIGRALMSSPRLLVLDEPSLGLAPQIIAQVYAVLGQLKTAGQAILLVEQAVGKALALSDRAYVLDRGRVVLSGPCEQVRNDKLLRDAYLGL